MNKEKIETMKNNALNVIKTSAEKIEQTRKTRKEKKEEVMKSKQDFINNNNIRTVEFYNKNKKFEMKIVVCDFFELYNSNGIIPNKIKTHLPDISGNKAHLGSIILNEGNQKFVLFIDKMIESFSTYISEWVGYSLVKNLNIFTASFTGLDHMLTALNNTYKQRNKDYVDFDNFIKDDNNLLQVVKDLNNYADSIIKSICTLRDKLHLVTTQKEIKFIRFYILFGYSSSINGLNVGLNVFKANKNFKVKYTDGGLVAIPKKR